MSEFNKQRSQELLRNLEKEGYGGVILFPGPNIGYYTGFSIGLSERLAAAILPCKGEPIFVINELEKELRGLDTWFKHRAVWLEEEDPVKLLADTLKLKGLGCEKLGIVEDAPWGWVNKLKMLLPESQFVDASSIVSHIRMIKTSQELDWIRMACVIADRALGNAFEKLHSGMTESELSTLLSAEMRRLGGGQSFPGVLFGERAALPHGAPGERELKPGDNILVDMGCTVHGYWSDLTRTVFYGEPSEKHKHVYDTVLRANRMAFDLIKPGATCESVDAAARRVIEEEGYGKYFIHRLGHGIGLQIHEPPYIVKNNVLPLEAGMVFSNEPGIYILGDVGVRIEDTVTCTQSGCESLTKFKRDLVTYPVKD